MESKIVKIGFVHVDSGQLVICDPCYIDSEYQKPDSQGKPDHAHDIYKHKDDEKLWQFCYGEKSPVKNVNSFPGNYGEIIPEYGMSPNDLIEKGLFIKTRLDRTPHIPKGEFSYRGISKTTNDEKQYGQLKHILGHDGVAVAFCTGMGDGKYDVYAEIVDAGECGERVKKVWVEFISDFELKEMRKTGN